MPRQVCINCGSTIIKINGKYVCADCGRKIEYEEREDDFLIEDRLYAK